MALNAPSIVLDAPNKEVSWLPVSGAETYNIYLNGSLEDSGVIEEYYTFSTLSNGDYIQASAFSLGEGESNLSNTVTYYSSLSTPTISISGSNITWGAITGAEYYKVYKNGSYVSDVYATSYTPTTFSNGDKITVKAAREEGYSSGSPLLSSASNEITVVKSLLTPTIDLDTLTISWSAITNADKYYIYKNSSEVTNTTSLSYTFGSLTEGDELNIKAYNTSWNILSSLSNTETYTEIIPLDPPVITLDMLEEEVTWSAISGADEYNIYINSSYSDSTSSLSYSLPTLNNGDIIKVTAYDTITENESQFSNSVTYYISLSAPTITISGTTVSWGAITGAEAYRIYINNTIDISSQEGRTYNASALSVGDKIEVKAVRYTSYSPSALYSDLSNPIYYNISSLSAPTISIDNLTISWSAIQYANRYYIYVNGGQITYTSNLSHTFSSLTAGDEIKITAHYTVYNVTSDYSNTITYGVTPEPELKPIIMRRRLL